MPDLVALIESVPLPVYALLGAVGILLIAASFVRGDEQGHHVSARPGDRPTDAETARILERSYSEPTDATSYARQRERDQA